MIDYLEVLRLNHLGYSQRTIETPAHCLRYTVREVLAEMDKHGIQWPVDDDITNADLNRMIFPDKYKSACLYVEPDYPYIHRELAKRGVTLTLLREEYRCKCYDEGKRPYPYARIKQRKYIMSPEDLTKSVRFSGLFFSPRKVCSRRLHKTTI